MDQFPKYFLSLFILVVYSNLQQPNTDVAENSSCKSCCYSRFLNNEKSILLFANKSLKKDFHVGENLSDNQFNFDQYDIVLENFEKQNKVLDFAEKIDFRNKVAKTRNKDYLNLDKNI